MTTPVDSKWLVMTELKCKRTGVAILSALGLSALAISFLIHIYGLDLRIAAELHDLSMGEAGWMTGKASPWIKFYRYGEYPAVIMAVIAFVAFLFTKAGKLPVKFAKPCLVIVLTVILGPGLVVNGILKNFWGRPRPADTVLFGGTCPERGLADPGGPGAGKSFVCGHCANAFAVASGVALFPYFPGVAGLFLGAGLTFGALGSFARMAQGAHYLSDAFWSGIIVLSIIVWLYFCVFKIPALERD
ncbi:MAG: phosphatase PAP2 family protein [Pseudomonadota bacterium]